MIHKDKIKHFIISFILATVIYWLAKNLILAASATLLFGLAKELYDQVKKKNTIKESFIDFLVNILGAFFGILFIQYLIL